MRRLLGLAQRTHPGCGYIKPQVPQEPAYISHSELPTMRPSIASTQPVSKPEAETTAVPACVRITVRPTTLRSCSTRTATTSKRCACVSDSTTQAPSKTGAPEEDHMTSCKVC